ncbi:hypothetical protein A6409_09875 [Prescottella equi]|nr:hypothetical protein A6409_09875 [Prescottella equi]
MVEVAFGCRVVEAREGTGIGESSREPVVESGRQVRLHLRIGERSARMRDRGPAGGIEPFETTFTDLTDGPIAERLESVMGPTQAGKIRFGGEPARSG